MIFDRNIDPSQTQKINFSHKKSTFHIQSQHFLKKSTPLKKSRPLSKKSTPHKKVVDTLKKSSALEKSCQPCIKKVNLFLQKGDFSKANTRKKLTFHKKVDPTQKSRRHFTMLLKCRRLFLCADDFFKVPTTFMKCRRLF